MRTLDDAPCRPLIWLSSAVSCLLLAACGLVQELEQESTCQGGDCADARVIEDAAALGDMDMASLPVVATPDMRSSADMDSIQDLDSSETAPDMDTSPSCEEDESCGETPLILTQGTVAVGDFHTCVLDEQGAIACLGSALFDQLRAPAGSGYRSLTAGGAFTCALDSAGTPVCWGGTNSSILSPPEGEVFTSLHAGLYHVCGLRADGKARCWGQSNERVTDTPTQTTFVQISAGGEHTCGLDEQGALTCWGRNTTQMPGPFTWIATSHYNVCAIRRDDGSIVCDERSNDALGATNPPAGSFARVSMKWSHGCGHREDGSVECWGYNEYKQIEPPKDVIFSEVVAGGYHSCGRDRVGQLVCWGRNYKAQLQPLEGTYLDVALGQVHLCGIQRTDGLTTCWGDTNVGAPLSPPLVKASSLALGDGIGCIIEQGQARARCWGSAGGTFQDAEGVACGGTSCCVYGSQRTSACAGLNTGAVSIMPQGVYAHLAVSPHHGCAIEQGGGQIVCWGTSLIDDQAQAWENAPTGAALSVEASYFSHPRDPTRFEVASCALMAPDGALTCWGPSNSLIVARAPTDAKLEHLSCGDRACCGLDDQSRLMCWGAGYSSSTIDASTWLFSQQFKRVSHGPEGACGVLVNDEIVCW